MESIDKQFDMYSDFGFASLYCWNTDGSTEVSNLAGNLVIRLPDYITGEPVCSMLGKHDIDDSIRKLLEIVPRLGLVPETVVESIKDKTQLNIEEDIAQFDYIFSVEMHAKLEGGQYKTKRKQLSKFRRDYGDEVIIKNIDFTDKQAHVRIRKLFDEWAQQKSHSDEETMIEVEALNKFLTNAVVFGLIGFELVADKRTLGFAIVEIVHENQVIYHFQKTLRNSPGIDTYLTNEIAKALLTKGCQYINWEQDLGIEGLRIAKMSWKPKKMLKKYNIKKTRLQ